jgi:hypothetical protein
MKVVRNNISLLNIKILINQEVFQPPPLSLRIPITPHLLSKTEIPPIKKRDNDKKIPSTMAETDTSITYSPTVAGPSGPPGSPGLPGPPGPKGLDG